MKFLKTGLFALVAVTASNFASAAVDVSDAVTDIEGAAAPIAALGGAVLAIMVGVKIYKWVRRGL